MSRELKRFTTFVWELSVIWNNEIKSTKILIVINMIIIMLMMIMMMSSKNFFNNTKIKEASLKKLDCDRDNECAMYFLTTENMFINLL